ncbi:MAG TPA: DUF4398 domain-containing protein [Anaeromyxobacteraceae bacterium]|nr:DUF4398 domain-containing protein [Anaeromyxobacteraceae bacterium]
MRPLLAFATLALAGCGPVRYTGVLWDADREIAAARAAGAADRAPYELTLSEEYLHQAKVLAGHARYDDAGDYGHRAIEAARVAHQKAAGQAAPEVK